MKTSINGGVKYHLWPDIFPNSQACWRLNHKVELALPSLPLSKSLIYLPFIEPHYMPGILLGADYTKKNKM